MLPNLVQAFAARYPKVIATDVFCVALPIGHHLSNKRSLRLVNLAKESFIGYKPSQPRTALYASVMQLLSAARAAIKTPSSTG